MTVKLLDNTPAVLSLKQLCKDYGQSFELTSGWLSQLIKIGRKDKAIRKTTCRLLSQDYQPAHPARPQVQQDDGDFTLCPAISRSGRRRLYVMSSNNTKFEYKQSRSGRPTSIIRKNQKHKSSTGKPVAVSSRLAGRIYRESCKRRSCTPSRDTPTSSSREDSMDSMSPVQNFTEIP